MTWLVPDWPAPARVHAFVTTREGGVSSGAHASLNLGRHCGDEPSNVDRNRRIVAEHLPASPAWLAQAHGIAVANLDRVAAGAAPVADASFTREPGCVAAILTADCLPVLFCDDAGEAVAIAHAGWRGLAAGVLENTVARMGLPGGSLMAWLGPAIGPRAFEVGAEVREAFLARDPAAEAAFAPHAAGKYLADLYLLARQRLSRAGIARVFGGGFCTFHEGDRFFSYRREKASGRMGSFIWLE